MASASSEDLDPRKMMSAELAGAHTRSTTTGIDIHTWNRGDKYLTRGRFNGKQFGQQLGATEAEAVPALRRLLVDIEDGRFLPPAQARRRILPGPFTTRSLMRTSLTDSFGRRQAVGAETSESYFQRLTPMIEFAEQSEVRRRYPFAPDIDRQIALDFRAWLFARKVHRNGRPSTAEKPISARQVHNMLSCIRAVVCSAKRPTWTAYRRRPPIPSRGK